jgi:hypothetical protein
MPEKAAFLAFLVAAFALNIAPGPDMLYVIGRSVGPTNTPSDETMPAYSSSSFWDRRAAAVFACGL